MTNRITSGRQRYDRTTIALHWLIVAAVVFQWIGGHTIDWFPRGPLKIDARSVHIVVGVVVVAATLYRIFWRGYRGARLPPAERGLLGFAAKGMHWALMANLVALVGLGLSLAWLRGDSLFNLARIPAFRDYAPTARHLLANEITDLHSLAANLMLALAGAHAAAGLAHHFILKDGVLRRMA